MKIRRKAFHIFPRQGCKIRFLNVVRHGGGICGPGYTSGSAYLSQSPPARKVIGAIHKNWCSAVFFAILAQMSFLLSQLPA